MELFSTATVQRNEKVDYWKYLCCETYANLELEAFDRRNFEGSLCRSVGMPLSFIKVSSSAAKITRSEKHIVRPASHQFHLFVQEQGEGVCSQDGRGAHLRRGDFTLVDISRPYHVEFDDFCSALSVGIPQELLNSYLPVPSDIVCRTMVGTHGLNRLTSLMIESLCNQVHEDQRVQIGPSVIRALLDVIAAAYAETYDACVSDSAVAGSRRVQIKNVIESNLADPRLSPGQIATQVGISRRYLRLLFSREEETICQLILRRRLQEAAGQLAQWMWRGTTIRHRVPLGLRRRGSFLACIPGPIRCESASIPAIETWVSVVDELPSTAQTARLPGRRLTSARARRARKTPHKSRRFPRPGARLRLQMAEAGTRLPL